MVYACACVCVHHATRPPMRARALPFGAPPGGACRRETLRGPPAPHRGGSEKEGGAPISSDRRRRGACLAGCMGAPLLRRRRLGKIDGHM